jgi:hypothetical protein
MLNPSHRDAYLDEDANGEAARSGKHGDPLARARQQHAAYVKALEREVAGAPPPLSLAGGGCGDDIILTSSPPTSYPSVFMSPPSAAAAAAGGSPLSVTPVRKKRPNPTSTPVSVLNIISRSAPEIDTVLYTTPTKSDGLMAAADSTDATRVFSNITGVPRTRGQPGEDGTTATADTNRGSSRESDGKSSQRSTPSNTSTLTGEEVGDFASASDTHQSSVLSYERLAFNRPKKISLSSPVPASPIRSPRSSGSSSSSSSSSSLSFNIPPPLPLISQALLPVRNNPPMTGVLGRPDTLPSFRHIEWSPKDHEMCLELDESSLSRYFPALKLADEPPLSAAETSKPTWGSPDKRKRRGSGSGGGAATLRTRAVGRKTFYYQAPVTVYARPDALRQIDRWNHRMEIALNEAADASVQGGSNNKAERRTGTADSSSSNESTKGKKKKQQKTEKEGSSQENAGKGGDEEHAESFGPGADEGKDAFLESKRGCDGSTADAQKGTKTSESKVNSPHKKKRRRKRLRRRPPGYAKSAHEKQKGSGEKTAAPQRENMPLDAVPPAAESRHVDPSSVPALSLTFDSQFECGNLLRAQLVGTAACKSSGGRNRGKELKMGVQEFDLVLQNDLFTNGHVQWCVFVDNFAGVDE